MINKAIAHVIPWFPKPLIWQFSKKYVAGETLLHAVEVSKDINRKGMLVTIDLLGEKINNLQDAEDNKKAYFQILEAISDNSIQGNISLKPTFFGLNIDSEKCYSLIREIVVQAERKNCTVRIDMEDSECTTLEIDLFKTLKNEFPETVGLVFQAYLKRTLNDISALQQLYNNKHRLNFRLCKGIYVEPEKIAYKDAKKIRDNFLVLLETIIRAGDYPAIATHDRYLVEEAFKLIEKYNLPTDAYEFQMLYGVTPGLRDEIVSAGHKMRIYIPFGQDWFAYCTRRLKENPDMMREVVKGLFVKN